VRKNRSPDFSWLEAARSAARALARVAFFVSSTVDFIPLALAMAAMSVASNSHASNSPFQPP
jgi:hypothetical protein